MATEKHGPREPTIPPTATADKIKNQEEKNMKWYNFETRFLTLRDALRGFLHGEKIRYELSGGPGFYHFEILTDSTGAEKINVFLDSVTITAA